MRSAAYLLCALLAVAACSRAQRQATLDESEFVVQPARSASILGDWVLVNADETQFVGAQTVELRLKPGAFTLVAQYPGEGLVVVDGTASFDPNGGLLTLTPRSNTRATSGRGAPLLPVGETLSVLATAADNTMVFAQPGDALREPTSVWHKSTAARRAGVDAVLSQRDSANVP